MKKIYLTLIAGMMSYYADGAVITNNTMPDKKTNPLENIIIDYAPLVAILPEETRFQTRYNKEREKNNGGLNKRLTYPNITSSYRRKHCDGEMVRTPHVKA